jgi:DNA processing protein
MVRGIGPMLTAAIGATDVQRIRSDLAAWQAAGIRILDWEDPAYPALMRNVPDAPPTLFVKGRWPVMTPRAVAVVGTRSASRKALGVAHQLGFDLAEAGITVVSGLALGIDTAAHFAAMASPSGITIGVLGSGILNVYPYNHKEIARAVEQRGALLCEVRPDAQENASALVARNRIISGLCEAIVIVQTDIDGGALHAARFAQSQGRKVYAIDDPLGSPDARRGVEHLRAIGAMMLPPDVSGIDWLA